MDKNMNPQEERPITVDRVLSPKDRKRIRRRKRLPARLLDRARDAMKRKREDKQPKGPVPSR